MAWRLYLPKEWAANHERRHKAGVPDEIDFKTKPEIALEQIGAALKAGLSRGVVLIVNGARNFPNYGEVKFPSLAGMLAKSITRPLADPADSQTSWTAAEKRRP